MDFRFVAYYGFPFENDGIEQEREREMKRV